jgi:hypothetical protein
LETILLLFLVASALYISIQHFSAGKHFSGRDMAAFRKAKKLREELKEVENLVAPKSEPDHAVTIGLKSKKPDP